MRNIARSVIVASCLALSVSAFFCAAPARAQTDSRPYSRSVRLNGPLGSLQGIFVARPSRALSVPRPAVIPQQQPEEAAPAESPTDYVIPQPLPRPPAYVLNPHPEAGEMQGDAQASDKSAEKPAGESPPAQKTSAPPPPPKTYPVKVKVASADDSVFTMPDVTGFGMMSPELPRPEMRAPLVGNSLFMPRIQVASLTPTLGPFGMPPNIIEQDLDAVEERAAPESAPLPQQSDAGEEKTLAPASPPAVKALSKEDASGLPEPLSKTIEEAPPPHPSPQKTEMKADENNKAAPAAFSADEAELKRVKLEDDNVPVALASPMVYVKHKRRFALPDGENMTLAEAVSHSVTSHPEIGMARARTMQAKAGVRVANSSLMPQIDARLTYGGGNDLGTSSTTNVNQTAGALTLRQLLFDFGATKYDIDRSNRLFESERFRVLDKVEDIALRTADAYIKVLEQRRLLALADDYLAAHERLAQLVRLNQNNGNGTIADVSRINSRVLEAHTILTSLEADLENASDQLERLVHAKPGQMRPPPGLNGTLPSQVETALAMIDRTHPRLLSINAGSASIDADIDSKRMQFLPKVSAEVQGDWIDYSNPVGSSDSDVRGLLVVRQKIFDGLARNGIVDEARAKKTENLLLYRNERDNIAADIRQAYRAIDSAKLKLSVLRQSVDTGGKVNDLYIEQFKGGKRTLFELLDAQSVLYSARRDYISSQYEDVRARLILLRSLGRLAQTLAG